MFILTCWLTKLAQAQNNSSETLFRKQIELLYCESTDQGFHTLKKGDVEMKRSTELPMIMPLREGHWYRFIVVGDPEATRFEMKLGLQGVGDIITDKYYNRKTGEFWTSFSFVCSRSRKYLMTFSQRGPHKQMKGSIAIMEKEGGSPSGYYTMK